MKQHVYRHHPKEYSEAFEKSVPTTASSTQLTITESFNKKRKIDSKSKEHKEITSAITKFLAMDCLPIYTVTKPGFKQLIDYAFQSRYEIPSRNVFSDNMLPNLYNDTKAKLLNDIKDIKWFSATSDIWSSIGLYPYISFTLHYISENWELKCKVLETHPFPKDHTGQNIAEVLTEILDMWNIQLNQIVTLTTDSAANMKLAGTTLGVIRIPCFGHVLHNGINFALTPAEIEDALACCRKISSKISMSWKKRRDLTTIQQELGLPIKAVPTDNNTRWNSKFKLICFVLEQENAIRRIFNDRLTSCLIPSAEIFQVNQIRYNLPPFKK